MDMTIVLAVALRNPELLRAATPLLSKILAAGGSLLGWTGQEFAVGFARFAVLPPEVHDSAAATSELLHARPLPLDQGHQRGVPAWMHVLRMIGAMCGDNVSVAVCRGHVARSVIATDQGTLGVGAVIARALALVTTARRREAWIEREITQLDEVQGWLRPIGERARLYAGKATLLVRVPLRGGIVRGSERVDPSGQWSSADGEPDAPPRLPGRNPSRLHAASPYVLSVPAVASSPLRGALTIVRADPGCGGTRALDAAAAARGVGVHVLRIVGVGRGVEPLGALRVALGRTEFADDRRAAAESLQRGRGLRMDAAGVLLEGACGAGGIIHLHALSGIDPATLTAVVTAVKTHAISLVVHLDALEPVPAVLAALTVAATWDVAPLTDRERLAFVSAMVPADFDVRLIRRLARSRLPLLAVWSSVRTLIERGVWSAGESRAGNVREHVQPWLASGGELLSLVAHAPGLLQTAEVIQLAAELGAVEPQNVLASLLRAEILIEVEIGALSFAYESYADVVLRELELGKVERALRAVAAFVDAHTQGFVRMHAADLWARAGEGARCAELALDLAARADDLELDTTPLLLLARMHDGALPLASVRRMVSSLPPMQSMHSAYDLQCYPEAPPTGVLPTESEQESSADLALARAGAESAAAARTSTPPTADAAHAPPTGGAAQVASGPAVVAAKAISQPPDGDVSTLSVRDALYTAMLDALHGHDGAVLERCHRALGAAGVPEPQTLLALGLSQGALGQFGAAFATLRPLNEGHDAVAARAGVALVDICARAGRYDDALSFALSTLARARRDADLETAAVIARLIERIGGDLRRAQPTS
jgi:hypothetical protein